MSLNSLRLLFFFFNDPAPPEIYPLPPPDALPIPPRSRAPCTAAPTPAATATRWRSRLPAWLDEVLEQRAGRRRGPVARPHAAREQTTLAVDDVHRRRTEHAGLDPRHLAALIDQDRC